VSSGEQNTGAQERALREYVRRRGWKLQQIYLCQGVSGTSSTVCASVVKFNSLNHNTLLMNSMEEMMREIRTNLPFQTLERWSTRPDLELVKLASHAVLPEMWNDHG